MRALAGIGTVALLLAGSVSGQAQAGNSSAKAAVSPPAAQEAAKEWSFSGSVSGYVIPDGEDYLSPVLTADRGWLHLEFRHNYESIDTGSAWLGYNLSFGEKWTLDLTPMVGGVFGHTKGVAPGWRLALSRGAFEWATEAEFVFDAEDSENDFFYAWSELTWSPTDWLWVGLALQRTRAYETDLDIQRGILAGFSFKGVDFTAYVFNWGWDDPTFVFSVGVEF